MCAAGKAQEFPFKVAQTFRYRMDFSEAMSCDVALSRLYKNLPVSIKKNIMIFEFKFPEMFAEHLRIHNLKRLVGGEEDKLVKTLLRILVELVGGVVNLRKFEVEMADHQKLGEVFRLIEVRRLDLVDARDAIHLGDGLKVLSVAPNGGDEVAFRKGFLSLANVRDASVVLMLKHKLVLALLQRLFHLLLILSTCGHADLSNDHGAGLNI